MFISQMHQWMHFQNNLTQLILSSLQFILLIYLKYRYTKKTAA